MLEEWPEEEGWEAAARPEGPQASRRVAQEWALSMATSENALGT